MTDAAPSGEPPTYTCARCNAARQAKKARGGSWQRPNGWKSIAGQMTCGKCKDDGFVTRAVSIPIASVSVAGITPEPDKPAAWNMLRRHYYDATNQVARLLNWAMTELAINDPMRAALPGTKLPPYKAPYLYPGAVALGTNLYSHTIAAVLRRADAAYRKRRLDLFLGRASLPTFHSSQPVPIKLDSCDLREEDGAILVTANLQKQRFVLRLAGGSEFRYQRKTLRNIIAGKITGLELSLHEISGGRSDHRPLVGKGKRLIAKIAILVPKESRPGGGRLLVSTGKDCFLRYLIEGTSSDHVINGDHIRRRVMEHRQRLDRTSADMKRWHEWPSEKRKQMEDARQPWIERHRNRMSAWCHDMSRLVVDYAVRRRLNEIVYDGSVTDYIREFPWFKLKTLIGAKAAQAGITFTDASAPESASASVVSADTAALADS